MKTTSREFEADYIYHLTTNALIGLKNKIASDWKEACREPYNEYVADSKKFNQSWITKHFGRSLICIMYFDEFVEYRKDKTDDFFRWNNWLLFERPYAKSEQVLTRVQSLAKENSMAAEMIVVDADDYSRITKYEKYA